MKRTYLLSIIILLILLSATAITRNIGFANPHLSTFDESLYAKLGFQLTRDPANYNSQSTYKYCVNQGRPLPDYLNRPLFKHPPLYSYLISLTYYFTTKPTYKTAWSISLISGVLMILLIYYLGKILYGEKVALIAAFLLFLDPIHWLCTQKVWMETTIAIFIWIALFFIIKAAKETDYKYFYWAGAATGCAILTKYTGLLIFPVGLSLILIYNKNIIKSKHFWAWLVISFVFFIPWLFWNYRIYGNKFFIEMIGVHSEIKSRLARLGTDWQLWILLFVIFALIILFLKRRKDILNLLMFSKVRAALLGTAIVLLFIQPYMIEGLLNMVNLSHVPTNGWISGIFKQEPWYFYLRRLLELSPFYIFAFGSVFFLIKPKKSDKILIAAGAWILTMAIICGNYQCRYILSAVPALLLLSGRTMIWTWEKLKEVAGSPMRLLIYRIVFVYILFMFLSKTVSMDLFLALPNQTCYF